MERIEELRQKYYESIMLLQNKDDIIDALPKPEYESFFALIKGIIEMLEIEFNKTLEMSVIEPDMQEYIEEELNLLKLKIKICNELLKQAQTDKKIEEEALVIPKKNIIFATTDSGNVCVESDIKDIPKDYLDAVTESLEQLQEGFTENNTEKGRMLVNNAKLSKVHEIKHFKVRIIYKNLSPDTVYILMVKMKKSNNDRRDRIEVEDRSALCEAQYRLLKKQIEDPIFKEQLITNNQEILTRIIRNIEQKKR